MLVSKIKIKNYLKNLVKESLVKGGTINIDGKNFLVVNSLEHLEGMTDLIIQGQEGGSAGFGNYFENVVLEAFGNKYLQLNDGAGGPFPFADVHDDAPGYVGMYSVKAKRILNDQKLGGGKIFPGQLRAMLRHPTTLSDFPNANLKPGLIGGSLEPSVFSLAKRVGLPIKVQIVDPTDATPTFRYEADRSATTDPRENKGILCVKTGNIEYAKRCLGSGIERRGYKHSTLTLDKNTGFYKINGSEKIMYRDDNTLEVLNDPTVVAMKNQLVQLIQQHNLNSVADFEIWKKRKGKKQAIPIDQLALINVFYTEFKKAKSRKKKSIETPFQPSISTVSTYESFNDVIMNNTGNFQEPIYLLITGGFSNFEDIKKTLDGKLPTMPNIRSITEKVEKVLDFVINDLKDIKSIGRRIMTVFSKEELVSKTKSMDEKNFPDGFFIDVIVSGKGKSLEYFSPSSDNLNFPFAAIPGSGILTTLKKYLRDKNKPPEKQPEDFEILPELEAILEKVPVLPDSFPKGLAIDKDLANKTLIKIAVETFLIEIENVEIPISPNANPQDVEDFKKAIKEFSLFEKMSQLSQRTRVMTGSEVRQLDENIENYRKRVVLPLARKVLPQSAVVDKEMLDQRALMRRIGIIKEFVDMPKETPFLIQAPQASSVLLKTEINNSSKIEPVLSLIFNMANLIDLIIAIGSFDPLLAKNMLLTGSRTMQESMLYERILNDLIKYSKR